MRYCCQTQIIIVTLRFMCVCRCYLSISFASNYCQLIKQTVGGKIAVGSHVWVEDPDESWLDGEVVEVNGDEIKVNCTSGKTVSIS